jgi:hypothetical protein
VVQKNWGAMAEQFTLSERSANAVVSLIRYLGMTFWPVNLAAFYPLHPSSHLQIWGASLVLLLLTGLVLLQTRMRPYLLTGWLWFIGMLVPVLGLVQVGSQSMADRYLYLPQTGLMVALIWTAHSLWAGSRTGRWIMCLTASASLVAMIPLTVRQIRTWRSTETLFAHAVASTRNNARAHSILGYELAQNGKRDEGIAHLNESLRINPDIAEAHGKLGHVAEQGLNYEQAVAHYERAVALNQGLVEAHNNLAWIRSVHPDAALRNGAQAVRLAERACTLTRYERTICIGTLAAALAEAGRFEEAVQTAMRARSNALKWGEVDLARTNEQLMESYRAGKPFRDSRMLSK